MGLPLENPSKTIRLLRRAADGDERGWQELMERHRDRLRRMVSLRLDRRMQPRIDASDVVQDAFVEAWSKLDRYLDEPNLPFYLWLRAITGHKLMTLHRFHLGTEIRNAGREVSLYRGAMPEASSAMLAAQLAGNLTQPSEAAVRTETKLRLQESLNLLDPLDREVLMLRHMEHLTNSETAQVLEINTSAASKRYIRALEKLRGVFGDA